MQNILFRSVLVLGALAAVGCMDMGEDDVPEGYEFVEGQVFESDTTSMSSSLNGPMDNEDGPTSNSDDDNPLGQRYCDGSIRCCNASSCHIVACEGDGNPSCGANCTIGTYDPKGPSCRIVRVKEQAQPVNISARAKPKRKGR